MWSPTLLLYINPLIKCIVLVFFRWKVIFDGTCGIHGIWQPWTSWMLRWNVGFTTMSSCITRTQCFFHLGYWHDGSGWASVVMCFKVWAWMKAYLPLVGELSFDHKHIYTSPWWANKECDHWNAKPFGGGKNK